MIEPSTRELEPEPPGMREFPAAATTLATMVTTVDMTVDMTVDTTVVMVPMMDMTVVMAAGKSKCQINIL